jgi:hypothetical protein
VRRRGKRLPCAGTLGGRASRRISQRHRIEGHSDNQRNRIGCLPTGASDHPPRRRGGALAPHRQFRGHAARLLRRHGHSGYDARAVGVEANSRRARRHARGDIFPGDASCGAEHLEMRTRDHGCGGGSRRRGREREDQHGEQDHRAMVASGRGPFGTRALDRPWAIPVASLCPCASRHRDADSGS